MGKLFTESYVLVEVDTKRVNDQFEIQLTKKSQSDYGDRYACSESFDSHSEALAHGVSDKYWEYKDFTILMVYRRNMWPDDED